MRYSTNMNNRQPTDDKPDEICPRPDKPVNLTTQPLAPAIYPTSVWICNEPEETDRMLAGEAEGYVYQRDKHPNADALAEKVRQLPSCRPSPAWVSLKASTPTGFGSGLRSTNRTSRMTSSTLNRSISRAHFTPLQRPTKPSIIRCGTNPACRPH